MGILDFLRPKPAIFEPAALAPAEPIATPAPVPASSSAPPSRVDIGVARVQDVAPLVNDVAILAQEMELARARRWSLRYCSRMNV